MTSKNYSRYKDKIEEYAFYLQKLQAFRRRYHITSDKFQVCCPERGKTYNPLQGHAMVAYPNSAVGLLYITPLQQLSILVGYGDISPYPNKDVFIANAKFEESIDPTNYTWYIGLQAPQWVTGMPEEINASKDWCMVSRQWLLDETLFDYRLFWKIEHSGEPKFGGRRAAPPAYSDRFKKGSTWASAK